MRVKEYQRKKIEDLLERENIDVSDSFDKFFDKFQVDMIDYKFNRDEANER